MKFYNPLEEWGFFNNQLTVPDRLLNDPAEFLAVEDFEIGPARLRTAACFVVGSSILLYLLGQTTLPIVFVVMAVFMFGVDLLSPKRHSLRFTRDGLEIRKGKKCVVCPWHVFDVSGHVIDDRQSNAPTVRLPIHPTMVNDISLTKDARTTAVGEATKTMFFQAHPETSQLHIRLVFALPPVDCGELILGIAHRMVGDVVVASQPQPSQVMQEFDLRQIGDDMVEVPVTKLTFPPECSGCGEETESLHPVNAESLLIGLVKVGVAVVFVPMCESCRKRTVRKEWLVFLASVLIALLVAIGLVLVTSHLFEVDVEERNTRLIIATMLGPIFFTLPIRRLMMTSWLDPFGVADLNTGTVRLRFRRKGYAAKVAEVSQ